MLNKILFFALVAFSGFIAGRIGHIFGGDKKGPHHWIYGLFLIIAGTIFQKNLWAALIFLFGAGLFVSDLKDFLNLKFYGVDDVKIKKFWGID